MQEEDVTMAGHRATRGKDDDNLGQGFTPASHPYLFVQCSGRRRNVAGVELAVLCLLGSFRGPGFFSHD